MTLVTLKKWLKSFPVLVAFKRGTLDLLNRSQNFNDTLKSGNFPLKVPYGPHGNLGWISESELKVSESASNTQNRFFIQIGAGAGDQDVRADFRDGFTEFIKGHSPEPTDIIILVEPNPINIPALQKCWESHPTAHIHRVGIVPKARSGDLLPFYYTQLDAPHFQVASFNKTHVLNHYPSLLEEDLTVIKVTSIDLSSFITKVTDGRHVSLLAMDIEGLDAEVLLDTDFGRLNVDLVSFEFSHLGRRTRKVQRHLTRCGFELIGHGVDHNGFDLLYKKK